MTDSARSPAWAASAVSGPRTSAWSGFWPSPHSMRAVTTRRGDDPADQPGIRLGRRDVGQELLAPELLADEVGAGVVRPDREDQQEDPAALRAEAAERRGRRPAAPRDRAGG